MASDGVFKVVKVVYGISTGVAEPHQESVAATEQHNLTGTFMTSLGDGLAQNPPLGTTILEAPCKVSRRAPSDLGARTTCKRRILLMLLQPIGTSRTRR